MMAKKGSTPFATKIKKGITLDPRDPKTWWMVYAAQKHSRIPIMALMSDHSMFLAGVPAKKFYSDAKTNVNTTAAVAAYYGFDSASGGGDTYNYEAEALGQKLIYSDNAMPTADFRDPLIKEHKDLKKLMAPDWLSAGRIRFILDVIKLNKVLGYKTGKFCAPFSLAVTLRSYPKLMKDLKKNPQFAHDLFTVLSDEILPSYLKLQKKYCGVSAATGADAAPPTAATLDTAAMLTSIRNRRAPITMNSRCTAMQAKPATRNHCAPPRFRRSAPAPIIVM